MRTTFGKQLTLLTLIATLVIGVAVGQAAGQGSEEDLRLVPSANPARLVDARGEEQLEANCLSCHTAQPILTHAGFTPQVWDSEVQKMRNTYGAEISDEDAAWIIAYLSDNYADDPVSAENMLINGLNTTKSQEPVFQSGPPQPSGPPEVTPEASPANFKRA
jgi:sulfite dehydrogenase (cytochrome) subunit B